MSLYVLDTDILQLYQDDYPLRDRSLADSTASRLIILGDSRVEQEATLHRASPAGISSICLRTASRLNWRHFSR